jgi:hypothetical protein
MADANSPLYIHPTLTAIAIKYRQDGFIADQVLPRVPVDRQEFIHLSDRLGDWITPPDDLVGRTGTPNALANSAQDPTTLATSNRGLDEAVPNQDAQNGPTESALGRATQRIMSLVELRREIRVANLFATAANFTYTTTLSGTGQWSDYTNSDPVAALLAELDKPFVRPNALVMGREVWTKLRQHPVVVEGILGTGAVRGVVDLQAVAALLEIDRIIVGSGWWNSAAKGQTVTKARVWGKHCCGVYLGGLGGPDGGNTWGYTAQFGSRVAGTYVDPKIGLWGGVYVRAGESVKEVVAAPEFGFQFLNAVA